MSEINLNFYPWLRRGLAQALTNPQPAADPAITATVYLNREPLRHQLTLRGPGDVVGLSRAQVVRTEPTDGTRDFEYAFFPFVEFSTPDLPWLFTPAGASDHLRPWLVLVVVESQQAALLPGAANMPMVLDTTRGQLPSLAESWAWAHVQATVTAGLPADPAEALDSMPEAFIARLTAPRLLQPQTDYLACVVPAFRGGVEAGLGQPVDVASSAQDAWADDAGDDAPVLLPVYFSWSFATGDAGEFETLVRRLRRVELPPTVGTVALDVGDAGAGMPVEAGQTATFKGALAATDARKAGFSDKDFGERFRNALRPLLRVTEVAETADPQPYDALTDDPVVAPPLYGSMQTGIDIIPLPDEQPRWLRELNANPHHRAAAGLGASVVRADQEALMAEAWRQADAARQVNRLFQGAALALRVSRPQYEVLTAPEVDDAAILQLSRPAHARIKLAGSSTVYGSLRQSGMPDGVISSAFRRTTRPGGVLARTANRIRSNPTAYTLSTTVTTRVIEDPELFRQMVQPLNAKGMGVVTSLPEFQTPDDTTGLPDFTAVLDREIDEIADVVQRADSIVTVATRRPTARSATRLRGILLDTKVQAAQKATQFQRYAANADREAAQPLRQAAAALEDVATQADIAINARVSSDSAALKQMSQKLDIAQQRAAALRENAAVRAAVDRATDFRRELPFTPRVDTGVFPGTDTTPTQPSVNLADVAQALRLKLDPLPALASRLNERVTVPASVWDGQAETMPASVRVTPQFTRPLYRRLIRLGAHFMVPGIGDIENNIVGVLEVNSAFVEAFLVGANHELGREFLWREYPAALNGTWLRRFWEADRDDIPAIGPDWNARAALGDNTTGDATGSSLVLLVRGDVIRRYPDMVVSAIPATWDGNFRVPDTSRAREEPSFTGRLPGGAAFYGFNGFTIPDANGTPTVGGNAGYFFVLEEHPTAPRFGINESETYGLSLSSLRDWNALSRGHFADDPSALPAYLPVTGETTTIGGLQWGADSAQTAAITLQRPVRVYIHASELLPGE